MARSVALFTIRIPVIELQEMAAPIPASMTAGDIVKILQEDHETVHDFVRDWDLLKWDSPAVEVKVIATNDGTSATSTATWQPGKGDR